MKNIREIARELIAEKGPITSKDIKKLIKHESLLNIDDAASLICTVQIYSSNPTAFFG